MREIKFRVWNTKEKKMIQHFEHARLDYTLNYYEKTKHVTYPMQFTGLKDKNGVDIYEGDIVKFKGTSATRNEGDYEIFWQSKKCGFGMKESNDSNYPKIIGMQSGKHLEVIGNIYE